jgi:hypothetical protein
MGAAGGGGAEGAGEGAPAPGATKFAPHAGHAATCPGSAATPAAQKGHRTETGMAKF